MKMDEKQLVNKILAGDSKAYKTFIDTYKRLVAHVVFRMVYNPTDREDLCQDVFIKAYQNLQGFQFQSKISTWLARIAYNTCVNYLQKMRTPLLGDSTPEDLSFESVATRDMDPYAEAEGSDLNRMIRRHVNALPPLFRAIVTLYHLDGMKYDEISQVLELPVGTVKSYLFRARRILKKKLLELQEDVLW